MATLAENAAAVKAAQVAIDAAIVAKGGTTTGGLSNAATAIASIPAGGIGGWEKKQWKNDGNLHIWIVVERVDTEKDKTFAIAMYSNGIMIDWGDGSSSYSTSGWNYHSYKDTGTYCITFDVTSPYRGAITPWFTTYSGSGAPLLHYSSCKIRQIELGNCENIGGDSTFGAFWSLSELRYLKWTTSQVTNVPIRTFADDISLSSIEGLTALTIGAYAFSSCRNLVSDVASSATSVGSNSFTNCFSLVKAGIPNVSGFTKVPAYIYNNCYSISSVVIPEAINYISYSAFDGCSSLRDIVFKPTTPPTIQNANAFSGMPSNCIVTVPSGTLAAYKAAANYTNIAKYMVEAE